MDHARMTVFGDNNSAGGKKNMTTAQAREELKMMCEARDPCAYAAQVNFTRRIREMLSRPPADIPVPPDYSTPNAVSARAREWARQGPCPFRRAKNHSDTHCRWALPTTYGLYAKFAAVVQRRKVEGA